MKALVEKINALIADFQVNAAAQVEKGNKAAGTRARKAALELSKELKEFRKVSVEEAKKEAPFTYTIKMGYISVAHLLYYYNSVSILSRIFSQPFSSILSTK